MLSLASPAGMASWSCLDDMVVWFGLLLRWVGGWFLAWVEGEDGCREWKLKRRVGRGGGGIYCVRSEVLGPHSLTSQHTVLAIRSKVGMTQL